VTLLAGLGLDPVATIVVLAFLPPDRHRRVVLARSGAPRDILRAGNAAARR
jgi:hypothetical protein